MSDGGEAPEGGSFPGGSFPGPWIFMVARARRATDLALSGSRQVVRLRMLLLCLSALGSLGAIGCLVTGHWGLALRLFIATLVLLGGLLLQAIL